MRLASKTEAMNFVAVIVFDSNPTRCISWSARNWKPVLHNELCPNFNFTVPFPGFSQTTPIVNSSWSKRWLAIRSSTRSMIAEIRDLPLRFTQRQPYRWKLSLYGLTHENHLLVNSESDTKARKSPGQFKPRNAKSKSMQRTQQRATLYNSMPDPEP